uniref:Uncharacterized protein n=1 Tax=Oryza glumipatula TaxID=40148 RepID=A0A0D9YLD4_9ORYZ
MCPSSRMVIDKEPFRRNRTHRSSTMDTSDSGGSAAISRAIPMRTSGSIGQSCLVRQWQRERSLPHRVWRLWWLLAHRPVKECRDGIKLIFAPLYSLFLTIVLILRSRRILMSHQALVFAEAVQIPYSAGSGRLTSDMLPVLRLGKMLLLRTILIPDSSMIKQKVASQHV